jgi:iron(III) transport system substrate-binding protein
MRQDFRWRVKAGVERWRALDKATQWMIAGGLGVVAVLSLTVAIWATTRGGPRNEGVVTAAGGRVVLYTSVDDFIVRPIIAEFERVHGTKVDLVTDTEATKTTGLVERLLAEKDAPRADVWWSSEMLGSQTLAREGVLDPFLPAALKEFPQGWPAGLAAADGAWHGFAQRARVIVYSTNRVSKADAPTRLRDLTESRWSGRVGIARPQFGTTRTHLAALIAVHGEEETRRWLLAMINNGVRLYDGNASVVRAVAFGEIDVGLTDTDDVFAGRANDWAVDMVFESMDRVPARNAQRPAGLPSMGAVVIPNTAGLVRGGPNPNQATRLLNFIFSAETERLLATSVSGNIPIREGLAKELKVASVPAVMAVDPAALQAALPKADALANELFPIAK